jgi:hypothetical protein
LFLAEEPFERRVVFTIDDAGGSGLPSAARFSRYASSSASYSATAVAWSSSALVHASMET